MSIVQLNLTHFVPGFTRFVQSFGVMGTILRNLILYWSVHDSCREYDNNKRLNLEEDHNSAHN